MDLIEMLLNDPVVLFSFGGLLIVLGICSFYVYYFMHKIANNE